MDMTSISRLGKTLKSGAKKRAPEILTGIGIAGMISTTVMAVKATPKALKLIEAAEREKYNELHDTGEFKVGKEPLTTVETVKVAWKPYIPAAVTGVASVGCLIGASSVNARRNAALATAYQLSTTALSEYKEKVVETIGEKKEKTIREKVAQEKVNNNPVTKNEVVMTGNGKTLILDVMTGRYFESDINSVERAVNKINRRMTTGEMYASLNDLHTEIGLSTTHVGDAVGWNVDRLIELDWSSTIADDGRPCLVLGFLSEPNYGFDDLY